MGGCAGVRVYLHVCWSEGGVCVTHVQGGFAGGRVGG